MTASHNHLNKEMIIYSLLWLTVSDSDHHILCDNGSTAEVITCEKEEASKLGPVCVKAWLIWDMCSQKEYF